MKMKFSTRTLVYRLPSLYFICMHLIVCILDLVYGTDTPWLDLVLLTCSIPLLCNKRWFNLLFGVLSGMLWFYLFFAVTDDMADYIRGEDHYTHPIGYFTFGYTLVLSSLLFSVLLLVFTIRKLPMPAPHRAGA